MKDGPPTNFLFHELPEPVEGVERREKRERQMVVWLETVGARGWRAAGEAAGITDEQVFRWFRLYPDFKAAHEQTRDATAVRLEAIVDAIATGEVDATPAQVTLLQFRLKGLRPEVYRERSAIAIGTTAGGATGDGGEAGRARLLLAEWTT